MLANLSRDCCAWSGVWEGNWIGNKTLAYNPAFLHSPSNSHFLFNTIYVTWGYTYVKAEAPTISMTSESPISSDVCELCTAWYSLNMDKNSSANKPCCALALCTQRGRGLPQRFNFFLMTQSSMTILKPGHGKSCLAKILLLDRIMISPRRQVKDY